jgi:ribosomal protein S6
MQTIAKKASAVKTSDKGDLIKVYEIGYLLVSSIPKEKVAENVSALKDIIIKKGAKIIAEEAPEFTALAYTMVKKIGAANHRFNEGYFGWIKFDLAASEIESVKKAFEEHVNMLRVLVITTIRDITYLGKKAPASIQAEDVVAGADVAGEVAPIDTATKAAASTEEIDKSIDEMVK